MTTSATEFRGWKVPVERNIGSAIPFSFVFQLSEHLSPRCVANRFSQPLILVHIRNTQTLNKDRLVFAYGLCRELVQIVSAGVCYFGVNPGYLKSRFVSIVTALYFTTQTTLANLQTPFFLLQKLRIWQLLAIAKSRQIFQANIYTDGSFCLFQGLDVGFNKDTNKVSLSRISAYRQRLNRRVFRQRTRPTDFQRFALSCQRQFITFQSKSVVGITHRLSRFATLKSGIVSATRKEVSESSVKMAKRLLQYNATYFIQEYGCRLFFELRKQRGGSVIAQRLLILLPRCCSRLKHSIIDKSGTTKGLSKLLFLRVGWKESILEGLATLHAYSLHEIMCYVK